MGLPDIHSFWTGPALGPLEQICLASFADRGHRVYLHSYEPYELPAGVERIDARTLAPEGVTLIHRRTGSPALFSDKYRYLIQKHFDGIWADCDIFAIRPLDYAGPYLLPARRLADGRLEATPAILRIPADSPLLATLLANFDDYRRTYRYLSLRRQMKFRLKALVTPDFGLSYLPWGIVGPTALARGIEEFGLWDQRGPSYEELFAAEGRGLFGPEQTVDLARGFTTHFLHSQVPPGAPETPRPGSFYAWCVDQVGARTPFFRAAR